MAACQGLQGPVNHIRMVIYAVRYLSQRELWCTCLIAALAPSFSVSFAKRLQPQSPNVQPRHLDCGFTSERLTFNRLMREAIRVAHDTTIETPNDD